MAGIPSSALIEFPDLYTRFKQEDYNKQILNMNIAKQHEKEQEQQSKGIEAQLEKLRGNLKNAPYNAAEEALKR